jgi:peptide chain release factor 3
VGSGTDFLGVYDCTSKQVIRFERAESGSRRAPMWTCPVDDPSLVEGLGETRARELREEVDLLEAAGNGFDLERFLAGQVSPVFFGSAMSNFGIEPFLDRFVDLAPPPRPRKTTAGDLDPATPRFSGFVFKIQANMDPKHRDRIAFVRVCSGRFARGMQVNHVRGEKPLTLSRTLQFMGQDRIVIDEAFPGDILGVWDGGNLRIGDTIVEGTPLEFEAVPRFSPEHFVEARLGDPLKRKQLKKGLEQLSEEGAVQLFFDRQRLERDPILGAVGVLQFEVIQHRLESEYGVTLRLKQLPYRHARWVEGEPFNPEQFERPGFSTCVLDAEGRPLVLFETEFALNWAIDKNPALRFVAAVQPARAGGARG